MRYQLTMDDYAFCNTIVCAGHHEIKYHTCALVEDLLNEGVLGDFAECGVLFGAHPAIMLRALLRRGIRNHKVHLFDSFQGIPRATTDDPELQQATYGLSSGKMESSGISVSPVENTLNNLRKWGAYDAGLIEVHPGWFQDTLPADAPKLGPLALLRVDVDLYESTRVVYEHLYPLVVTGGYIIDDDYGRHDGEAPACRRALESVIGSQSVVEVVGQPDTSWWRKL